MVAYTLKYRESSVVEIACSNEISNTWKLSKQVVHTKSYAPHLASNVLQQKPITSVYFIQVK